MRWCASSSKEMIYCSHVDTGGQHAWKVPLNMNSVFVVTITGGELQKNLLLNLEVFLADSIP